MTASSPDATHRNNNIITRPASANSLSSTSPTMARSSSSSTTDQNKVSKRKGTRSVSTLTPAQLARKRANDREAQRAIRARTKEHIERLESELEELKSRQNRDATVQELLRRNKALEDELNRLRDNMGVSMASSPYSATHGILTPTLHGRHSPTYDDNLSNASPKTSPFHNSDFSNAPRIHEYNAAYVPFPNGGDAWVTSAPTPTIPSTVSSPSSTHTDEYGTSYLATSAPMMASSSSMQNSEEAKIEYDDGNDQGFHIDSGSSSSGGTPPLPAMGLPSYVQQQQQQQQQYQPHHQVPWNMYASYYQAVPSPVH